MLNGLNTITSLIFPVVTFPYAARVLMPAGIGSVNFLNSIVNYIIILTSLGIPTYAVREVAKYHNDLRSRNKTTVEMIILSTLLCAAGYVIVWILGTFVEQIHRQAALFYILSLSILFTSIGVNWFYQGIEDFKFITIRAIIIRAVCAAALFIFVKDSSDILIYGLIVVGSTVGNNFLNFVHLRKHIRIFQFRWSELDIKKHLKPTLEVFTLSLIASLYVHLNSIMLGFISGDTEVGYYTAGTRISSIGLTAIASISTVLLPRCSSLIKEGEFDKFREIIKKSINLGLALAWPLTIGLMALATPITIIFCGREYLPSIPVVLINAPVIIFITLTNIIGIQVLYPLDKIKLVIMSVAGAALMNLGLNFLLCPSLGAKGAAIAALVAQFTNLALQLIFCQKHFRIPISDILNPMYIVASIVMGICTMTICKLIPSYALQLVIGFCVGTIVYIFILYVRKDSLFMETVTTLKNKFIRKKEAI